MANSISGNKIVEDGHSWTSLFNGQDFDGWTHVGDGEFEIEDGLLKTKGGMGLLYYEPQPFENVVIKIVYKNPNGNNSGVFIRIPEKPTEAWMPVNKGYEIQIYDHGDEYHCTGVLYSLTKALAYPSDPNIWNVMEVTLKGGETIVKINDNLVTHFVEGQEVPPKKIWYEPDRGPRPDRGYFGLQNHGDDDIVFFKEVSYRPLDSDD